MMVTILVSHQDEGVPLLSRNAGTNQYNSQEIQIRLCAFLAAPMLFLYRCKIKSFLEALFCSLLHYKYFRNKHKHCGGKRRNGHSSGKTRCSMYRCSLPSDIAIISPSCIRAEVTGEHEE